MAVAHSFGALVRRRRKALDLTQVALAQLVGCAESLIRKIESEERRPSRQVAERLADALEIPQEQRGLFVQVARGERAADQFVLLGQPAAAQQRAVTEAHPPALPVPLTALVGREVELATLDSLLADLATRLLTVVAPGGMGKTRLAIALAGRQCGAARFPHGVFFLDLTPLERTDEVAAKLAALFGLLPEHQAEAQILTYLRGRSLLLILDNAEHLLDAAPLFRSILQAAPGVALLVTSRERLQLHGEQLFPLAGLAIPADQALAEHSDATRLFLQAARRASPTWAPGPPDLPAIAAICRISGGMPLAIELAGAWAASLTPPAILAELRQNLDLLSTTMRDVPPRQRSVRAVFGATLRQLGPGLQQVFMRLAVFRAGFTHQAAAQVAGASLRDLAELAGAALLHYDPERERYALHELLRQYAAERLAQDAPSESSTLDAHASFFCRYVAEHAPRLRSGEQRAAQVALELEQENIGAAWRQAVRQRQLDLIDGATHALGLFYEQRADTVRGAMIFDAEVAALAESPLLRPELRARLLSWRSAFLRPLGQLPEAERHARRALEILGETTDTSDEWRAAAAHVHLRLAMAVDDLRGADAMAEYEIALRFYELTGRIWEQSFVVYHIARLCCDLDDLDAAARYGRASLALREACRDARGGAHTLQLLSRICLARGQLEEALALARRCRDAFEQLGDRAGIAKGLRQLATVLYWQGRCAEALPLAEQSLAIYLDYGLSVEVGTTHTLIGLLRTALGQFERADADARAAIELHQHNAGALAEDNTALGIALLAAGRDHEAEAVLRAAAAQPEQRWRSAVPRAAPLLALCLLRRGARSAAQHLLAEALAGASERRAFMPLVVSLAVAAHLLAATGDTSRAAEIAALASACPDMLDNCGLWVRRQLVVAAEPSATVVAGEPLEVLCEAARQLARAWGKG